LGSVLGPAKGEGNEMAQWVLKTNGNVVPRRTVRPLNTQELHSEEERTKRAVFDELIERRWGTAMSPPSSTQQIKNQEDFESYEDDDETPRDLPEINDAVDINGKAIDQQPAYDQIINCEVQLQHGSKLERGRVVKRAIGPDGTTAGEYNENPILNSVVYEVEFPDGDVQEYAANVIAENMLSQVDSDGYSLSLIQGIVDHRSNSSAVPKSEKYIITQSGQRRL